MNIIKIAAGISACFAAGLLLAYLNVPMALMFGPIILIIIAHRFNVSLTIPKGTLTFVQMVLGTSVGLMFTRVDLSQFDHLLLIMLIMVSCLAVQFTVSFLVPQTGGVVSSGISAGSGAGQWRQFWR